MAAVDDRSVVSDLPDLELVTLAQAGSEPAVAELWVRHYGATLRTASRVARQPRDAEEIASDAFTAMIQACRNGHGPTTSVRAYLATSVRNFAAKRATGASSAEILSDDIATFDHAATTDPDQVAHLAELSIVREAFAALPQRWQIVLWRTAVDHENHQNVADAMGLTRNGVAALALRARKALKTAYLQAHVSRGTVESTCQPFLPLLAQAAVRTTRNAALTGHLSGCRRCRDRLAELRLIDQNLAGIVLPAALALTTTITTGTAAAVGAAAAVGGTSGGAGGGAVVGGTEAAAGGASGGGAVGGTAGVSGDVVSGVPHAWVSRLGQLVQLSPRAQMFLAGAVIVSGTAGVLYSVTRPPQPNPVARTTQPSVASSAVAPPAVPPVDPATVRLALSGPDSAVVITVDVRASSDAGEVDLAVGLPPGVRLTAFAGDWGSCRQVASSVQCRTAGDPRRGWSGTLTTDWSGLAGGLVQASVSGRYTDGAPLDAVVGISWPLT